MDDFTREDRNLLVRLGKWLRTRIVAQEAFIARSEDARDRREAGAIRDRLLRDERDLEGLRKRLEAAHPSALLAIGKVGTGG